VCLRCCATCGDSRHPSIFRLARGVIGMEPAELVLAVLVLGIYDLLAAIRVAWGRALSGVRWVRLPRYALELHGQLLLRSVERDLFVLEAFRLDHDRARRARSDRHVLRPIEDLLAVFPDLELVERRRAH